MPAPVPDLLNFDAQLRTTGLAYLERAGETPTNDLELAARLRERLPTSAPRYRSLRVEALRVLVAAATDTRDSPPPPGLLCDYGLELLGVGAREQAASELERATQLAEAAVNAGNEALRRTLARALDGHACARMALGEDARAAALGAEAIALLEALVAREQDQQDDASLELARASNNLGNALSKLGKRVQAYAAVERSVELYRSLAEADARHRPSLAAVLSNLGASLSELGDDRGAVEAAEEAVALLRAGVELAPSSPAGSAELARALHNLASCTLDLGDHTAGHAAALEAAAAYRELAQLVPQAFCADLIDTLDTLARALILCELEAELVVVMGEANAVHLRLRTLDANEALRRRSAYAKRSIKLCAREIPPEQALHWAEQAVENYAALAGEDPSYRTKHAAAVQHLSVHLSRAGRDAEALAASQETVAAWRLLAQEDSEHDTKLIAALQNLAQDLETLGRVDEAVETSTQVVALLEPLAAAAPTEHGDALVESLANLALDFAGLDRHAHALTLATRAVQLSRPLAAEDPDSYEPDLAHALDVLGSIEAALGHHEAAFACYCEGLHRLSRHYAIEPGDYEELRTELLSDLRALCEEAGLPWPDELDGA